MSCQVKLLQIITFFYIKFLNISIKCFQVAAVPGSSFYSRPFLGNTKVRFCFPKKIETLKEAANRLETFKTE